MAEKDKRRVVILVNVGGLTVKTKKLPVPPTTGDGGR